MRKHIHRGIAKIKQQPINIWGLLGVVVATGVLGLLVLGSQAAQDLISQEAEDANLTGNVRKIQDSLASGNDAIEFLDNQNMDIPTDGTNKAGWNIYTWGPYSDGQAKAIRRQKPGIIRWFVEWDRLLQDENKAGNPDREPDWNNPVFLDFLDSLEESNTTLVVSTWVKEDWPRRLAACGNCNYTDKTELFASYQQSLAAVISAHGVKAIWEAWNEPDLRWGALYNVLPEAGPVENITSEWQVYADLTKGWSLWSGGTKELWSKMHQMQTIFPYSSGGITQRYVNEVPLAERFKPYERYVDSTQWVDATAQHVNAISFHRYVDSTTVNDSRKYFDTILSELSKWDDAKGALAPFYVGESGPKSKSEIGYSQQDANELRARHNLFKSDSSTKNRYIGMIVHVFKDNAHNNEVTPWQTRKGWWEPDFDINDIVQE